VYCPPLLHRRHLTAPMISFAVRIRHGKAGGALVIGHDDDDDAPEDAERALVPWSRWSVPFLQRKIEDAVMSSLSDRDGVVFADVDFTSEDGRRRLPDVNATYTMSTAMAQFDNSLPGSPLFPFSNSGSSMFAFFKAAVASRRRTEMMSSLGRTESAAAEEMATQAQRGSKRRRAPGGGAASGGRAGGQH